MLPILLAFTTSIGYGTGDFLAGRVARRLSPALIVLYIQSVQSILVLLLALLTRQPFTLSALLWGMGAGLLNAVGLLLYYQALKIGRAGVVAPIVASGAVVPIVVSILTGTIPSPLAIAGLFLVMAGIVISTLAVGSQPEEAECPSPPCRGVTRSVRRTVYTRWHPKPCVMLAIASALSFGVFFILVNQGSFVAGEGVLWVVLGVQVGTLPTSLMSALLQGINRFLITETATLVLLGVITVLNLSADASLTYALSFGNLGIVSVLASLGPVITGVLARVITLERLSRLQGIGAGLIVLGTLAVVYQR